MQLLTKIEIKKKSCSVNFKRIYCLKRKGYNKIKGRHIKHLKRVSPKSIYANNIRNKFRL
jgi:hypothetical protein